MMSEIRVVGLLRVREPEVGLPLLEQISSIAAGIDGVEIWEAFANEGSDLVYLNERFASEDAYLRYERAVDAEDLRPRVGEAFDIEHLLLLSGTEDERLRSELDALGTVTLQPVASA